MIARSNPAAFKVQVTYRLTSHMQLVHHHQHDADVYSYYFNILSKRIWNWIFKNTQYFFLLENNSHISVLIQEI